MSTFADVASRKVGDVEKPKPLPVGTYLAITQGLPRQDKSSKKGTDFVEFSLKILAAGDDIDEEQLEAFGSPVGKTAKATFYITEDSLWRLTEFFGSLGLDEDMSIGEAISASPNHQVYVTMKHEVSQDGTTIFAKVAGFAAVAD